MHQVNIKTVKTRSKNKVFFIIFLICIAFLTISVGIYYFSRNSKDNIDNASVSIPQVDKIQYNKFYIALTSFKNIINNIYLEEIGDLNIAVFEEDSDFLSENIRNVNFIYIENQDIYSWQKENDFNGIIIVPFENIVKELKILSVNNVSIFDENNISEYPLVEIFEIEKINGNQEQTNYSSDKITTYVAGGEVIPARAVARKFRRTNDYTFPYKYVQELFTSANISSLLLENSISGRPEPCKGCVAFLGDEEAVEGFTYLGVDVIGANGNHMGDFGVKHIQRTGEVLDEVGILHTGSSGTNQDEASKPVFVEVDGFTFGFLGYDDVASYSWAGENYGGVARISLKNANGIKIVDIEKIKNDVTLAKEKADFVVVIISWGDREYVNYALDYQEELGHALVDAGVDLIIASHQHWASEIEYYKDKIIFYGLGNFVFDQTHTDPTRQGIFVKFYFYEGKLINYQIIPHQSCGPDQQLIDNESCEHFVPKILVEEDPVYKIIMDRVMEFSEI